jgi:hypothetical protein
MDTSRKATIAREWIIFALSLGLGGHIVLGLMLHAPEQWRWDELGAKGLLIGISVYVVVQLMRSCWWALRPKLERSIEEIER